MLVDAVLLGIVGATCMRATSTVQRVVVQSERNTWTGFLSSLSLYLSISVSFPLYLALSQYYKTNILNRAFLHFRTGNFNVEHIVRQLTNIRLNHIWK